MKHLLPGVAMAAALAIAAPVWAQNAPMTPASPPAAAPKAPAAPAANAPAAPMAKAPAKPAGTMTAKRPMHHRHMAMRRMNSGDQTTDQLNQQELQRITRGGPAPAPAGGPPPMGGNAPTSGNASPLAPSGSMSAPPPPAK